MTRGVTSTAERRERSQVTTAPTLILKSSTVSSHWILLPPLNLLQNFCCNKKGGRSYLGIREIYTTDKIPVIQYFLIKITWLPLISVEFWFSRWVTFIGDQLGYHGVSVYLLSVYVEDSTLEDRVWGDRHSVLALLTLCNSNFFQLL